MRRGRVSTIAGLAIAAGGCGGEDTPVTARVPDHIAHPAEPVPCPLGRPAAGWDARTLIGLSQGDAESLAAKQGCVVRVVWEDGKGAMLTMDARDDRVNVYLLDGRVAGVTAG